MQTNKALVPECCDVILIPRHTRTHFYMQTIDVHILVAPRALWQAELRCAYSSVCSQSVSTGFARSAPAVPLQHPPARCTSSQCMQTRDIPSMLVALLVDH